MIDLIKNYSIMARRMKKSVIRELLKLTDKPDIISFAGGLPDPQQFPYEVMEEVISETLKEYGKSALQYGATEGVTLLKEELIKFHKEDGLNLTEDNILITTASQQGLDLVSKVFIDPSDPILVELPSYLGGLQAFKSYGAHMIGVPTDEKGIRVDILEKYLKKLRENEEHYKMVYVVPDFQNPGGFTLTLDRRKKLIELGEEYKVIILEDSPYRELRYEGEELPSLYFLDKYYNVISLHTFSKIFVPGFRLGWIIAHPSIISKLVVAKQSVDLCTPAFSQYVAAVFMKKGYLRPHIQKVISVYKVKRDAMLKALEEYMPEIKGLKWTRPFGGLFLWLMLPEYMNADEMFYQALEEKVAYVIGSAFHCNNKGQNTIRLNFSYPTPEQIDEGIKRLANVIKKNIKKEYQQELERG